ncbi:hypothetical protein HBI56_164500 [Parastagonospora nodorum]|uniref:Glutamate-1-semialdehyde 2,1-aminomutase n=2 Tax=Phaeosphaeria nodorum (strain SN15 / ATCC MYA-4574 / FGSC 10173) TaxID=321614 RepID=A0A7U2IB47_PHANO|nr:hypothetical protein SNOG_13513 [Parastagonospora nodorum SN15]KAH3915300.1 hypothetical protein HBH56_072280 [Parastagonospora nodorum]EAT78960.1 hypothetical protein SNOG_13513 [Parastagonospora nodorum SN15]KAH3927257.1 hypothetical protein HBH54_152510 [Parastagonospora nodorum]KAH3951948.1 hypothetical protein HBH53_055860 [Parastagonospora nodorum]KAH3983206.1 hypothetical protein HBH52_066860 [Parastagonospora nodorum]
MTSTSDLAQGYEKSLTMKLEELERWYIKTNPGSAAIFNTATSVMPGGNTRTVLHHTPFPLVLESGKGTMVTSKDSKEYIDFVSEYSAAMYGHSHPKLHEAINEAMERGMQLGSVMGKEAEFATLIQKRFPSMELMRFTNSGTEATTMAVAAALAFTGRKKLIVFRNGYHGSTLSFGDSSGPNLNLPHDIIIAPYNDIATTQPLITTDIGAIIVEPLQSAGGCIPGTCEFLHFLRDAATASGAILIFDEIVTSRLDYHGMQGYWDITPDMTTLGKYIGGGFSFGCFGGRRDIMAQFDPRHAGHLSHSGTYNNNVFTMLAGIAGAKLITPEEIARINTLGDRTRKGIQDIVDAKGVAGFKAVGFGSAVGMQIQGSAAGVMRDVIYFHLLRQGIVIARRGFLMFNLMHTDEHVDEFLSCFAKTIEYCGSTSTTESDEVA